MRPYSASARPRAVGRPPPWVTRRMSLALTDLVARLATSRRMSSQWAEIRLVLTRWRERVLSGP